MFFFFKQKTAYDMRIIDWSSDVCSSDLCGAHAGSRGPAGYSARSECRPRSHEVIVLDTTVLAYAVGDAHPLRDPCRRLLSAHAMGRVEAATTLEDRTSVVEGKSVSVRVDLGGRRILKKKNTNTTQ